MTVGEKLRMTNSGSRLRDANSGCIQVGMQPQPVLFFRIWWILSTVSPFPLSGVSRQVLKTRKIGKRLQEGAGTPRSGFSLMVSTFEPSSLVLTSDTGSKRGLTPCVPGTWWAQERALRVCCWWSQSSLLLPALGTWQVVYVDWVGSCSSGVNWGRRRPRERPLVLLQQNLQGSSPSSTYGNLHKFVNFSVSVSIWAKGRMFPLLGFLPGASESACRELCVCSAGVSGQPVATHGHPEPRGWRERQEIGLWHPAAPRERLKIHFARRQSQGHVLGF